MRWLVVVSVAVSLGAELRTPNFHITAADANVAEFIGKWAEHHRRQLAVRWFGKEAPDWVDPCPLSALVTIDAPRASTTFRFAHGRVGAMRMSIAGPLHQLAGNVLPHEITHALFAHHFGRELPRWADEGSALLGEDDDQQRLRARMAREFLRQNRLVPLHTLLPMTEYPSSRDDVMLLYSQGFALTDFLLKRQDRATFLRFIADGLTTRDWNKAVQTSYGFQEVDDLELHWLRHMKTE